MNIIEKSDDLQENLLLKKHFSYQLQVIFSSAKAFVLWIAGDKTGEGGGHSGLHFSREGVRRLSGRRRSGVMKSY